jgi:general secretion pathway protein K
LSQQTRTGQRQHRERGFALLIVLWTLTLTTLIVTSLLAAGRQELRLQQTLRGAAEAEAAADGAVMEAAFRLTSGQWEPDVRVHRLRIGGAEAMVTVERDSGKINPNTAPPALIAALLRAVGVDPGAAGTLAMAIREFVANDSAARGTPGFARYAAAGLPYGPLGAPYSDVRQLRMVTGMTPAVLERLRPYLSVWSSDVIDPAAADPVVAKAWQDAKASLDEDLSAVHPDMYPYDIIATAVTPQGARFTRLATVRINGSGGAAIRRPPYQILSWGRPEIY